METTRMARSPRRRETGPQDHEPGGRAVEVIVRRSSARRRELDRYDSLMRAAGGLAAPAVPPSLVELARRRTAEAAS